MQWCDDVCMMSVCGGGGGGGAYTGLSLRGRGPDSARGKTRRVQESKRAGQSVMQGAEETAKCYQLVAVCNRKACRKGAGPPARIKDLQSWQLKACSAYPCPESGWPPLRAPDWPSLRTPDHPIARWIKAADPCRCDACISGAASVTGVLTAASAS